MEIMNNVLKANEEKNEVGASTALCALACGSLCVVGGGVSIVYMAAATIM